MKKTLLNLAVLAVLAIIIFAGFMIYRNSRPFWELHFFQVSDSETALTIVLDGKSYGEFVFEQAISKDQEGVIVVRQHGDLLLPIGEIEEIDVTWPPGYIILNVDGDRIFVLKKGVERRTATSPDRN